MAFRFESLDIWHMARAYATKVHKVTARFPRQEDYGLTSQLNRAVNSIVLNSRGLGQAFQQSVRLPSGYRRWFDL